MEPNAVTDVRQQPSESKSLLSHNSSATPETFAMERLPDHILSKILQCCSLSDLFKHCVLVCQKWHDLTRLIMSRADYSVCSKISRQGDSGEFVFAMLVTTMGEFDDPDQIVLVTTPALLTRAAIGDSVKEIAIFCPEPESVGDWENFSWVAEDHYHFLRRFQNVISLLFVNAEAKTFCMPFGRLTVRALFPSIQMVVWSYQAGKHKIVVNAHTKTHFVPEVTVEFYDKTICWTSSAAFNQIEGFIEVLQADGLVNFGTCNITIANHLFGILLPFGSINFAAQNARATNLFRLLTTLRIVVTNEQKLLETLTYVNKLQTLELDDEGQCSCILRLPRLPSVRKVIFRIHSSVLDQSTLSNIFNVEWLEIYSDNCGDIWMEHLLANIQEMPKLRRLSLDCFEDGYALCPMFIDDVLPQIAAKAPNLRRAELGPGLTPSLKGLVQTLEATPSLSLITLSLSEDSAKDVSIASLLPIITNTRVKIVGLKMRRPLQDLIEDIKDAAAGETSRDHHHGDTAKSNGVSSHSNGVGSNVPLKKRKVSAAVETFPENGGESITNESSSLSLPASLKIGHFNVKIFDEEIPSDEDEEALCDEVEEMTTADANGAKQAKEPQAENGDKWNRRKVVWVNWYTSHAYGKRETFDENDRKWLRIYTV